MNDHLLLTGGGTLGPVTPLLAVGSEWRKRAPEAKISWIGTPHGPERPLVEAARYDFHALRAPKFDRTRVWTLPFVLPMFLISCIQAFRLLKKIEPGAVVSAGAYVSVPVAFMAKLLGIPVWIHQLDVEPGMANKLMAPCAKKITVTWSESASAFSAKKTEVVGAMARKMVKLGEPKLARDRYAFDEHKKTLLIIGGGTGAASLNDIFAVIGKELEKKMNVLHLTGKGKALATLDEIGGTYIPLEFLQEGMADAYAAADMVVARAGMGTIAELSALGKPTILIPILKSHQEKNAKALKEREAAEVITYLTPQTLLQAIEKLAGDDARMQTLSDNIRTLFPLNADERIAHDIFTVLGG
jgi:UDP-N-acetylglucosamine--N-acetylmuramyl-(pentapeptide) pyrophosphoryl-undecaprenol N-acetylglucosamine transferase